jgi:p-aminobenzoyl-glutamate transporter AbgT
MNRIKAIGEKVPDQVKRLLIPVVLVIAAFVVMRYFLISANMDITEHRLLMM